MYARVTTLHAKPGTSIHQAMEIYLDIIREFRDRDGFRGSTFLMNEDTRRAITVTFWRDQICADAAGQESLPTLIDRIHELVDAPPDVSGYQVVDHALLPASAIDALIV